MVPTEPLIIMLPFILPKLAPIVSSKNLRSICSRAMDSDSSVSMLHLKKSGMERTVHAMNAVVAFRAPA